MCSIKILKMSDLKTDLAFQRHGCVSVCVVLEEWRALRAQLDWSPENRVHVFIARVEAAPFWKTRAHTALSDDRNLKK